jgi:hypothetical protein
VIALLVTVATVAPSAQAQGPTERGYDESGGVIGSLDNETATTPSGGGGPGGTGNTPSGDVREAPANSLPFTGLDVGLVVLMGAALVGTGFVIRRGARHQPER